MAFNYPYPNYNPGFAMPGYNAGYTQPTINNPTIPAAQSQAPQQPSLGLSPASRPVSNIAEANAVQADFSGALMVFPDVTNNRVYVKRWNIQTGAPEFSEFAPIHHETKSLEDKPVVEFATIDDLSDVKDLVYKLQKEIDNIKKPMTTASKGVKKNDTSDE